MIFVAMGAIPLVGAATYIRTDLLRNKAWRSLSAAAGPAVNALCFLACILPLDQRFGWVDPNSPLETWTNVQMFCGAMAVLQLFACFINLIPLPPLDGFRIIQPYLPATIVNRTRNPQVAMGFLLLLFFLLSNRQVGQSIYNIQDSVFDLLHLDPAIKEGIWRSYNFALFGRFD
jgi:Zn-dependent protease